MIKNPFLRRLVVRVCMLIGLVVAVASVAPIDRIALGTRARYNATQAERKRADRVHLAAHIGLFGALGAVAWFASAAIARSREDEANARLTSLILVLLLGCATEYAQHVTGRLPLERDDVVINLVSSASVFALLALFYRWRRRRTKPLFERDAVAYIMRDLD
jgi:hypothetical protein